MNMRGQSAPERKAFLLKAHSAPIVPPTVSSPCSVTHQIFSLSGFVIHTDLAGIAKLHSQWLALPLR